MLDVVKDFAQHLDRDTAIALLYPTYVLRTAADISASVQAFWADGGRRPLIGIKPPATLKFKWLIEMQGGWSNQTYAVGWNDVWHGSAIRK